MELGLGFLAPMGVEMQDAAGSANAAGENGYEQRRPPAATASHDNETSTTNGSVKFSISTSKRKQVSVAGISVSETSEEHTEFVSSVDGSGIQIAEGSSRRNLGPRVIPKIENSWKPEKRMKNLISAPGDSLKFVTEVQPAGPMEGVQYGLQVRSKNEASISQVKMDVIQSRELRAKLEKQALDEHLLDLPEPASLDAYEMMPVENFGEALMMGMGWMAGAGIGRRSTADVKPAQYVRRPERLGLGATPAPKKEVEKKYIKPGETREKKPDLVAPLGPDGKVRHMITVDEKLVERPKKGAYGGKLMSIISGNHAGLRGEVIGQKDQIASPGDRVAIKLVKSGETVHVDVKDLADVGSLEEERAMKQLKELRIGRSSEAKQAKDSTKSDRMESRGNARNGEKQDDDRRGEARPEKIKPWLRSQIRVRIISKRFQGGKLYLKKGRVIDVVTPTLCDILLDETGELVQGVRQEYLETALPKKGGRVVVVGGKYQGSIGKLLDKDQKRETAVVQMEESFEMVSLELDYLAEFIGDAADFGA